MQLIYHHALKPPLNFWSQIEKFISIHFLKMKIRNITRGYRKVSLDTLDDHTLENVFVFLDDFTKVNVLRATIGTLWNIRLQKVIQKKPLELYFGRTKEKSNSVLTKYTYHSTSRNLILMKSMAIPFNLNFHFDDFDGEKISEILTFITTNNIQQKINSLDFKSTECSLNMICEIFSLHKEYFRLIKGLFFNGYGEILPKCSQVLTEVTYLKLKHVIIDNKMLWPFYFSDIQKLELYYCEVTYLPRTLTSLKLVRCRFDGIAVFPTTLTELYIEGEDEEMYIPAILEIGQKLEKLTFLSSKHSEQLILCFMLFENLKYLEMNVPRRYDIINRSSIDEIIFTKQSIRNKLLKSVRLKRSTIKKNKWTYGSMFKAKLASRFSNSRILRDMSLVNEELRAQESRILNLRQVLTLCNLFVMPMDH